MPPAQLQRLLATALAHHQAGRLDEADRLYRQVRVAQPNNFDAVHLSGTVAYQKGNYKDALELLAHAQRLNPKSAQCEMRLGLAHAALGQHAEAEARLRGSLRLDARLVDAWLGLAVTLRVVGKIPNAIACYERVTEIDPRNASAHDQIGALKADTEGLAAGIPHFRKAVALNPKFAAAWCNLGLSLLAGEQFEEALTSFDRALAADPALVQARVGRALAYQQSFQLEKATVEYREALTRQPDHHEARSGHLLTLNYRDDCDRDTLFREHLEFGRVAEAKTPTVSFANSRVPDRKLRLAFLSPDLRAHSVAYFLEPLLRHLDPAQFEVVLYHDHFRVDAMSERLRQHAALWRNFVGQLHDVVEKTIRADQPDILVDLAGHTGINRLPLFARRLAPVQVSYLGYPNTSGLRTMDYRFVDEMTDPSEDDQARHTEKLIRFSSCAWAFEPPLQAPEPRRAARDGVTFGSFNNLAKLLPTTLRLWAQILNAVPGSRLLLKGQGVENALVRSVVENRIQTAGLDPARVQLLGRTAQMAAHLELYHQVDVALDAFPYHGTTTTCEALWMGVPVVTLRGDRHASRVGASLLQAIGRAEWIATNETEYVAIAAALAADLPRIDELRLTLREQMRASILLDHATQAARFGAALRRCWVEWCERTKA